MQLNGNARIVQFCRFLQERLFAPVEEEVGTLSEPLRLLVSACAWLPLERYIPLRRCVRGRKPHDRQNFVRAYLAKATLGMSDTRQLMHRLHTDVALRRLCGWERAEAVPSESSFSRAFAEIAGSQQLQQLQVELVQSVFQGHSVGHVIRDSTSIVAREKASKPAAPVKKAARKRGRPRKDEAPRQPAPTRLERQRSQSVEQMLEELPRQCNWGMKTNSQGKLQSWRGYKLHWDVSDSQIPLSCVLTSASLHDTQVAIPLATLTAQRVHSYYDLMDAGYDAQPIREHSVSLGHVPLIPRVGRHGEKPEPLAPAQRQRYGLRTLIERLTARLKDEFGGRTIRVRGAAKVMAHLMFGILILTVDQLQKLVT